MTENVSKKPVVFESPVIAEYKINPCRLFPAALWKNTGYCTQIQMCCDANVLHELVLYNENDIFTFFNQTRHLPTAVAHKVKHSPLVLLHNDYYSNEINNEFHEKRAYFRLKYSQTQSGLSLDRAYYLEDACLPDDAVEVARFIKLCYGYFMPSVEDVHSWMQRSVFDSRLWIWIKEKDTTIPVGLGVAEIDTILPEVSLEWIQVHPNFRGHGIASFIIQELVARSKAMGIDIITVSGEVDNDTNPEKVYRKNGFTGSDIWWCLRKRKE